MNLIEFIEAISRIAEKISPMTQYDRRSKLSLDERRVQDLHLKIEGLIFILYNRLKPKFKNTFNQISNKIIFGNSLDKNINGSLVGC